MGKFGCILCVCVLVLIRSTFPHPKDQKDEYVCMYVGLRRISTVSFGGEAAFRRKNWATAVLDGGRRRVRSGAGELVRRLRVSVGICARPPYDQSIDRGPGTRGPHITRPPPLPSPSPYSGARIQGAPATGLGD
jgi:hypothetical protein